MLMPHLSLRVLQSNRCSQPRRFIIRTMHEFLLMYDDVRGASSPRDSLLSFLQSTYEAGADLAKWDRGELEG